MEVALWRKVDFLSHQKFGLKRIFVTCEIVLKHMCCHHNNDCDAEELAAQRLLCSSFDFSFHLLFLFLFTFLCCCWLRFCLGLGPHRKSSCFFPLIQKYSKHLLLKNATNLSSVVSLLVFSPSFSFSTPAAKKLMQEEFGIWLCKTTKNKYMFPFKLFQR